MQPRLRRNLSELPLPDPGVFIMERSELKVLAGVLQREEEADEVEVVCGVARKTSIEESSEI